MTLLREPGVGAAAQPAEEVLEREAPAPRRYLPTPGRIHWLEWLVAVAVLVGASALAVWLTQDDVSGVTIEETSPLVLGARHLDGTAFIPEFVGLSGGDLPVVESSPLVLGVRMTDGMVFVPEYVGFNGGDAPFIEASPWILGVRHLEGVVFVPEYVGTSETEVPGLP
jgi:hypothetical protein